MLIDGHKQSDIIEYCNNFINKMEELKSYMVEFEKDGAMKNKIYLPDCAVGGENQQAGHPNHL